MGAVREERTKYVTRERVVGSGNQGGGINTCSGKLRTCNGGWGSRGVSDLGDGGRYGRRSVGPRVATEQRVARFSSPMENTQKTRKRNKAERETHRERELRQVQHK